MSTVYVGMDVGSKVTAVAARSESGEVVERLTFRTSRESLVESVTRYGEDVRVLFEEGELAGWAYSWRRGWNSNPRWTNAHNGFRVWPAARKGVMPARTTSTFILPTLRPTGSD